MNDKPMTVKEMIEKLKQYPQEMYVYTTWEGTVNEFYEDNIYISDARSMLEEINEIKPENRIFLDADGNFYKKRYEKKWY